MKENIPAAIKTHFGENLSTVATCWTLTRQDGVAFYFTDHDRDLEIDGNTYEASAGFLPRALAQTGGLQVDNSEVETFLDSDKITEADVAAGLYDFATVDVFVVNYESLGDGKFYLLQGWSLGEVELRDVDGKAEVRGKAQRLQSQVVEVYTPSCRAKLGDARCGVDLGAAAIAAASRLYILRHFEPADLLAINTYSTDYGPFDGFIFGNYGYPGGAMGYGPHIDVVRQLAAAGKLPFAYYNVLALGVVDVEYDGPWEGEWYTWLREFAYANGLVLKNTENESAYFQAGAFGIAPMLDHSLTTAALRREMVEKMFELAEAAAAGPCGLFLDQSWLAEAPWWFFCNRVGGAHYQATPPYRTCSHSFYDESYGANGIEPGRWPLWQAGMYQFYVLANQMAEERGVWALKNGEHRTIGSPAQNVPAPTFFENANANPNVIGTLVQGIAQWEAEEHAVISIDAEVGVNVPNERNLILDAWKATARRSAWISYTGPAAQTGGVPSAILNAFYLDAHQARTMESPPGQSFTSQSPYRYDGRVQSVTTARRTFIDADSVSAGSVVESAADPISEVFRGGVLTWIDGLNRGFEMEVKSWSPTTGEFELFLAMPNTINVGDAFTVSWGCDKRLETCRARFQNAVNFRGEPYVPGPDELARIYMP